MQLSDLGELDALEERLHDLMGSREDVDVVGLVNIFKVLKDAILPLIQRVSALEHAHVGITRSFSLPFEDGCISTLEALVHELQGTNGDVVDDCRSSVETIKHEMGELSAKLNLTIRAVGNQPVPALGGMEFTKAKLSKPRHYGGARDAKVVENFLFDMG